MNPPSTKCLIRDIRCHRVNKIRWCVQYVANCSRFFTVFEFYLENEAFAQELPFVKFILKLSILSIESGFIIECDVGLKVKIATLSISRIDNFKTFFHKWQFLCKCLFFEIKRKNRERLHTEHITEFCWLWNRMPRTKHTYLDFVLGGFINWYFINRLD